MGFTAPAFGERRQRLTGCVGITRQRWNLTPSAISALLRDQGVRRRSEGGRLLAGPCQTEQLDTHDPRWISAARASAMPHRAEPRGAYSALSGTGAYACSERSASAVEGNVARLDRGPMRRDMPAAVRELTPLHIARERISRGIGRIRGPRRGQRGCTTWYRCVLESRCPAARVRANFRDTRASWSFAREPPLHQHGIPLRRTAAAVIENRLLLWHEMQPALLRKTVSACCSSGRLTG